MERSLEKAIADAKTPVERTLAIHEYRLYEYVRNGARIQEIFQPADGIDQFEAYLLGSAYLREKFGVCSDVGLPEKHGEDWVVPISVGRGGEMKPLIFINERTGKLRCEGHLGVADAADYMRNFLSTFHGTPSVDPREKQNEPALAYIHSIMAESGGKMLWGFFFRNSSKEPLESLAKDFQKRGYQLLDISLNEKERKWRLHILKFEYHDADTLSQREYELVELAETTGLGSYDGWDVGPVGKDGRPDQTEARISMADIPTISYREGPTKK